MTILGLEHEYEIRRDGRTVDFRSLLPTLPLDLRALDPVDPFAHRMASGWVLTCDGAEAETVAPPVELRPGFTREVAAWAAEMADRLRGLLGSEEIRGVSTHVSVEVPDHLTMAVCGLFARRFAPALMLLGDGPEGQGLLVRPRHRRVELGLGFTAGPWLRAATALAAGAVLACTDVAAGRSSPRSLPAPTNARFEGARARFGWYVDRRAYGRDLYSAGRAARLRCGILRRSAGAVLEAGWTSARQSLLDHGVGAHTDLVDADELVSGRAPLHCDAAQARVPAPQDATPDASPLGAIRHEYRTGFELAPIAATWDFTVFAIEGAARSLYISVPRADHEQFLDDLDRGLLDTAIVAELHSPPAARILSSYAQAARGGRFDDVRLDALRPPERAYDGSFL